MTMSTAEPILTEDFHQDLIKRIESILTSSPEQEQPTELTQIYHKVVQEIIGCFPDEALKQILVGMEKDAESLRNHRETIKRLMMHKAIRRSRILTGENDPVEF